MGRSVRFAGHPGRTKERRVERPVNMRRARKKQTRRVGAEGDGK
jgi:hypothetical protein